MKATRKADDPQFSYSAQVYPPASPNADVPYSIYAISGGYAAGLSPPNLEMYRQNTWEGAGRQNMINFGGNLDSSGVPQNYHTSRNYYSPFSHSDLQYVYQSSPKTPSLDPGFAIASNNPHFLQMQQTQGNVFTVDQPALVTAPRNTSIQPDVIYQEPGSNFQAPLQRFGCMEKTQVTVQPSPPVSQELFSIPPTPELQYDDVLWANLETDMFAQELIQQYNLAPGDIGMVEAFSFESGPSMPAPTPSRSSTSAAQLPGYCSNIAAEPKTWATLSQALPDVGVSSSSSGRAGSASTSSGNATSSTSKEFPSLPLQAVAQDSGNQGSYPSLGINEFGGSAAMDHMVMEDSGISDGTSSSEDPSWQQVAPTQIPHGSYSVPQKNTVGTVRRNRRSSHGLENSFRDGPQNLSYNNSAAATAFNGGVMAMANDFTQLVGPGVSAMGPGVSGIRHLGEPRWAVQLLNLCGTAVASQHITRTQHLMWVLNDLASVVGDANQRFAAYGLRALYMRITNQMEAIQTFLRPRHLDQEATYGPKMVHRALVKFHELIPWHQNCYSASSQTLLEVCAGKSRLHLIDIGAGKGIEWPIFIDALVNRPGGPPSILRITMIKDRRREEPNTNNTNTVTSEAAEFMTRLVKFASGLGLHVEVNVVGKALECVTREDLRLRHGEILAVVCQFRLHRLSNEARVEQQQQQRPSSNKPLLAPRDKFLDFLFQLNPHVLIVSDNDVDHCQQEFLPRFQSGMAFWWNFFEGVHMGWYAGRDMQEREILESEAGSMLTNIVACEGVARFERNEPYVRWSRRIQRAGFVSKDLSDEAKKVCMNLVSNHGEFWDVVFDDANSVRLRWRKESMTFTSVWATPDHCSKHSCKCSMLHN